MPDILVIPGQESSTGLAEGSDAILQDFLLALLNNADFQPYLPNEMVNPFARLLLNTSNVPPLNQVVVAFNISMPLVRRNMIQDNPTYMSANLQRVNYTNTPGEIAMTIQLKTTRGDVYTTRTFQFESSNG